MLRIFRIDADDLLGLIGIKEGFSISFHQTRQHAACLDC